MRFFSLFLLLFLGQTFLGQSFAQQSCEALVASIDTAFSEASEVIMSTQIMQGKFEYAYSKLRLYKDDLGEWQSEQLEQRGLPRPPETRDEDEGAEPSFTFDCTQHELSSTGAGWDLQIVEQNKDFPIKDWAMKFTREQGQVVPTEIQGQIDTRILLIPFKGTILTSFANWTFPRN